MLVEDDALVKIDAEALEDTELVGTTSLEDLEIGDEMELDVRMTGLPLVSEMDESTSELEKVEELETPVLNGADELAGAVPENTLVGLVAGALEVVFHELIG
jgi:hypothetical protein